MLERNKRKLTFLDQAVQFFSTAAMQCCTQRACSILTLLPAGLPARRTAGVAGEATENARPENDGQSRNRISGSGKKRTPKFCYGFVCHFPVSQIPVPWLFGDVVRRFQVVQCQRSLARSYRAGPIIATSPSACARLHTVGSRLPNFT